MNRQTRVRELPQEDQPRYRADYYGLDALSNAELLQLVTSFTYLETGTELMQTAGSLKHLATMSVTELCQVEDVGPAAATAIKAAMELGRRLNLETSHQPQITSPSDSASVLMAHYGDKDQEHFAVMMLDTKNRVLGVETIYVGTVNTIYIREAEVFRPAVRRNATSIILCHNHPSGDPTPSPEDVATTRRLVEAGQTLGVEVLDHIIVGHNRYTSLKERGLWA